MTRRSLIAPPDGALNVNNPLENGQRALTDVLLTVTHKPGEVTVTGYASAGRAEMMLARYAPERNHPDYEVVRA